MNEDLLSTEKRSFTTIFKSKKEHERNELEEQADFMEEDDYQAQRAMKKVNTERIME